MMLLVLLVVVLLLVVVMRVMVQLMQSHRSVLDVSVMVLLLLLHVIDAKPVEAMLIKLDAVEKVERVLCSGRISVARGSSSGASDDCVESVEMSCVR